MTIPMHQQSDGSRATVPFKMPPRNLEIERAVLGALMLDRTVIDEVISQLRPEDFYQATHGDVFRAIHAVHGRAEAVDPFTVAEELKRQGCTEAAREDLVNFCEHGSPHNAVYYAGIVRELSSRRGLIDLGNTVLRDAYGHEKTVGQIVEESERNLLETIARNRKDNMRTADQIAPVAMEAIRTRKGGIVTGLKSGITALDRLTGGFQPGQLVIVGGRPGSGKTAFGVGVAERSAIDVGVPSMVASLEMTAESLVERILSGRCRINGERIRGVGEKLTDYEFRQLESEADRISHAPLLIDDAPAQTISQARAAALRAQAKYGLALHVFDYLQLAEAESKGKSRQEEITSITRGLKAMARELQVPVLALSQLNRNAETREDRRPRLADLRESGEIEQAADIVLLVHRPEYYDPNDQPGIAEIIVAKQRNGATGTVKAAFLKTLTRFENLAHVAEPIDADEQHMEF